jgi:protein phosphatase
MRLEAASATDQGKVRANNEDALLIDDQRALFAVADGMGGHRGGEVASHTAIEALRAAVANGVALHDAIEKANTAVLERAAGDDSLEGMGTTMTAAIALGGHQLLVGHVGDSRAYLLHDGALSRATEDHSLVEELVREGRLTPEQAESHPRRSVVTRALGMDAVEVDLYTIDVEAGDRLILCSDGLNTMVRERDIERIARNEPDPQRLAEALVTAANAAGG